ncbi:MAG: hypothetical protein ACRDBG_03035, partial [Waterburya sp.]
KLRNEPTAPKDFSVLQVFKSTFDITNTEVPTLVRILELKMADRKSDYYQLRKEWFRFDAFINDADPNLEMTDEEFLVFWDSVITVYDRKTNPAGFKYLKPSSIECPHYQSLSFDQEAKLMEKGGKRVYSQEGL